MFQAYGQKSSSAQSLIVVSYGLKMASLAINNDFKQESIEIIVSSKENILQEIQVKQCTHGAQCQFLWID